MPNNDKQTRADEVEIKKFLDINGLSRFMDLIKNWSAQKEHTHSMSDITGGDGSSLPIESGGTGATSAKAAQYNLLNDAPQVSTEEGVIDSSNIAFFTSGASTTNGAVQKLPASTLWGYIVSKIRANFGFTSSNVLPVSNGGTGATSFSAVRNNILGSLPDASEAISDSTPLLVTNSSNTGDIKKQTGSKVWDYIAGKIRSTFGFNSSNTLTLSNGGTGASNIIDAVKNLGVYSLNAGGSIGSNSDLNNMKTTGNYICNQDKVASTVSNSPTGGRAFTLKVGDLLGDTKYPYQEVIRYTDGASWRRTFNMASSTWNAWEPTSTARFGTTLWTGTWSAGSITVNGINDYDMYIMKTTGQNDNLMLGVRDGNVIHCYSVYSSTTNIMTLNTITIGITDNTLVRTMPRTWTLEGTAIKTANGALVINTIKGVL